MEDDVKLYDWLCMSLAAVMSVHVIYSTVDKRSAGFSNKWLTILRKDIGFLPACKSLMMIRWRQSLTRRLRRCCRNLRHWIGTCCKPMRVTWPAYKHCFHNQGS